MHCIYTIVITKVIYTIVITKVIYTIVITKVIYTIVITKVIYTIVITKVIYTIVITKVIYTIVITKGNLQLTVYLHPHNKIEHFCFGHAWALACICLFIYIWCHSTVYVIGLYYFSQLSFLFPIAFM